MVAFVPASQNFFYSSIFSIIPAISANQPDQKLTDPLFHKLQWIDILIYCVIFFDLLREDRVCLCAGSPSLHNTALGWIVGGKVQGILNSHSFTSKMAINWNALHLHSILTSFWEIDDYHKLFNRRTSLWTIFFIFNIFSFRCFGSNNFIFLVI